MNRKNMRQRVLIYLASSIALVLSFIALYQLPQLYFASDEFILLGDVYNNGIKAYLTNLGILRLLLGDHRPIGTLINNIFFYLFPFNTLPFIVYIYVFHAINIILAGTFVYRITKNITISVITTLCFSLPAASLQAIVCLAASVQTLGNQLFILLTLHMVLTGIEKKSIMYSIAAWVLGYIAFLFKETAFFVFILIFLLPWVIKPKLSIFRKPFLLILTVIGLIIIGFYKLLPYFIAGNGIHTDNVQKLFKIAWYVWYYPLISLGQFFIPFRFLSRAGLWLLPLLYPAARNINEFNYVGTVIVGDIISLLVSFSIICLIIVLFVTYKQYRRMVIFLCVYYIMCFIPIAVYLTDRGSSFIEFRYLYLPFFPISFLVGILFHWIGVNFLKIFRNKFVVYGILYGIFSLFIFKQVTIIQREVRQYVEWGTDIRETMTLLGNSLNLLPENPVFYITSDRDYFYPNNKIPFQLGTGYMVLLTFIDRPQIPKKLIGMFAFSLYFEQGYKEVDGQYVGYYWDKQSLKDSIRKNAIQPNQIVGLYYHSKDKVFENISSELLKELF